MPYTQADVTACLNKGNEVDYEYETCCSEDNCVPLQGYASTVPAPKEESQFLANLPGITDATLDILGFFGLGSRPTQPIQTQQQQRRNYAPWIILGVVLLLAIILYFVLKKKK